MACPSFWKQEIGSFEWVVYIWVVVLSIISLIVVLASPVPAREVFANDPGVWRTPQDEIVPMWLAVLFMAVLSAVIAATEYFMCLRRDRAGFAALRLWVGYVAMNLLTGAVTSFLKIYVAEARPDFLTRCYGSAGVPPPVYSSYVIHNIDSCPSGDDSLLKEGRLSWPSGHSSSSIASALFVFIYLVYRTRISNWVASQLAFVAGTVFVIIALFIGASRIVNNRHSPADVASGFLVGIICSLIYVVPLLWSMERHYYRRAKNSDQAVAMPDTE